MQKYSHLTEPERYHIHLMKKQEYSLTTIAKQMGSGAASSPSR